MFFSRIHLVFILTLSFSFMANGQDCPSDKLEEFIKKKYMKVPVEGAKYIYLNGCKYVIGIGIASPKTNNMSSINRVASIKARRTVLQLINGTEIESEQIIFYEEETTNNVTKSTEYFKDVISEKASGFVSGMEQLTSFYSEDKKSFIYVIYQKL